MIQSILSNEYVSAFGYVVGVISGCLAIYQSKQVKDKTGEIQRLETTINQLNAEIRNYQTTNMNNVNQGERSQYFQDNSGAVNIDNRG
ncbi:hypothetical protein QM637_05790 [Pantoea allii]|uniref:hypothetical protein n=1 Tax=Pantoea allii TaxID=574096 RepID=UPI0024B8010B|nr:hypothetical protein [Pantoea allii]MDJ0035346.1 hypothetical protein [Pantoea allii]